MNLEKKFYKFIVLLAVVFLFTYCDHELDNYDNIPPTHPENVQTFAGDNLVEVTWNDNHESDLSGYNVYYSETYWGDYELIGNTKNNFFIDYEAINGEIYYYAVAAYDFEGNESELSYDEVYGVARPEGMNQVIFDFNLFESNSGYDFSEFLVVPFNSNDENQSADFFFENDNGIFYLNVWDDTDIQDMGLTESFLDITFAPLSGWIPKMPEDNVKYVLAEVGHTYVIWTWDNHFAKIRVNSISPERIVFDWGYQLIEGEQQLKTARNNGPRKELPKKIIKN